VGTRSGDRYVVSDSERECFARDGFVHLPAVLTADEVDAIEINEAFAVQTLGCGHLLALDWAKLNQRGGAIALGHPIGASGARVLTTLLHLMEDKGYSKGIASLCVGGGMGIAMAVERG